MRKKIIIIVIVIIIIAFIYSYTKPISINTKNTKIDISNNKNINIQTINTTAYFTGLNYLYSINTLNLKKTTVSGYLGPGKAADSVFKIAKDEYAISNESTSINICGPDKCSQGNFISTITGYTFNNTFYNFQGVGDLAMYNNNLYATDVLNGAIVKINLSNFKASAVVTGLNNPHGIYFYKKNLYINLESFMYNKSNCNLIKINTINWTAIGCASTVGGYADGVAGYKNTLYIVRDYLQSSGYYNASVYRINLNTLKYTNLININNQYIDGIGYNSNQVLAVLRSANPDSLGVKHYNYIQGLYNITSGKPRLLVSGIFDGVYFPY